MKIVPIPQTKTKIGFHYFPDTLHYRMRDLSFWVPELHALGASWLTLYTPYDRAIPEQFIYALLSEGICPILHIHLPLATPPSSDEINILFETYARWGVSYVTLFDRPNLRKQWSPTTWAQTNLVERFLDIYLPYAETALNFGLIPVFPPLEPGGDYWDTAFLRAALLGIQRRGHINLLDRLVLSAYAWINNRNIDWGAGGPERWPDANPYYTPPGSEDHRGFRIFDWYLAISQATLDMSPKIILLGAGSRPGDHHDPGRPPVDHETHAQQNLALARLLAGETTIFEPIPPQVLACNFWLLSSTQDSPHASQAWYQPNGQTLPVVGRFHQWVKDNTPNSIRQNAHKVSFILPAEPRPIDHYLLLPSYDLNIADSYRNVIQSFIKKHRPTIGLSPAEALHANRVTVVSGSRSIPKVIIDGMIAAGCTVEYINRDGTLIASDIAPRE